MLISKTGLTVAALTSIAGLIATDSEVSNCKSVKTVVTTGLAAAAISVLALVVSIHKS